MAKAPLCAPGLLIPPSPHRQAEQRPLSSLSLSRAIAIAMATIKSLKARSIFDSRGNPTVEVLIFFISHFPIC
jgi:hypothetical protein